MSSGGAQQHRHGDWMILVDRWADFGSSPDTVAVKIARKVGRGVMEIYGPTGQYRSQIIEGERVMEGTDADHTWRLPVDSIDALCAALQDRDPTSERLTSKLETLLEREAGRVDSLLDVCKTAAVVRITNEPGGIATPS